MKHFNSSVAFATLSMSIVLSGCKSGTNWTKSSISPNQQPVASAPAPAKAHAPQTSYVLSAEAAGQYISFKIYNMGTSDLTIKKEDFALVNTGNQDARGVIPFNAESSIIDIPQNASLKPNESLQGRAMFKDVPDPLGRRLVFKPDSIGTFADIQPFQPK